MLQLALAVAVPYATAVLLGMTLGKLKLVGPLLRGVWYTVFWLAVIAQITAIVVASISYFTPVITGVKIGLIAASSVTLAMGLLLALVMFPVSRKGHGEEDAPTLPDGPSSPFGSPSVGGYDGAEAILVLAGAFLVIAGTFAVSFFPLRGIVRVTSRVLHVGILQA